MALAQLLRLGSGEASTRSAPHWCRAVSDLRSTQLARREDPAGPDPGNPLHQLPTNRAVRRPAAEPGRE